MALSDLLRHLPLERWRNPPPTVSVLRFEGVIAPRGRRALSLRRYAAAIERAFAQKRLSAVALSINSPGGSPVQSSLLYRRIRQLAAEKEVPVLAFAEDVAASGGYWLALAADEIYADETSLLGSVGVVSGGFGFVEAMARLGVERRLYTAGERKSLLDPFLPEKALDVERIGTLQRDLHDSFKELVRARRGAKLSGDEAQLFGGEIYSGRRALAHGLIDGIGEVRQVLRERFGERVRLRVFEPERRRFSLLGLGRPRRPELGDVASDLLARIEERLVWARFGL
jgi:signal peptide peptidase SppA